MYNAYFVDDDSLIVETFMSSPVFLECGYINAGHSTNPFDAVKEIKNVQPDAVFTDLKMPEMNGVELMNELKRAGFGGEFVVISAYREFEESRKFFLTGGFDYLNKPVSDEDLQTLLEKLSRKLTLNKTGADASKETPSPELNKITAYLHGNVAVKHSLESVSEKFELKPNYICNLFARYLKTTFVAYLTGIRMEEAALLLKTTHKSVKEISARCGYQDYFYFCRVFKEVYTSTTTEYREAEQ